MTPAEFIDDPKWADFLPETRSPKMARHLPSHEDCTKLDPETAASHLRRGGTLGAMRGYEERPGQIDMLKAIVRAFNSREHLMIEAGTGVGKSLAYLVPAILWASANDTPVVVSTATRNLQGQLIASDIPRALKVLGERSKDFKVALLKGRTNYLCLRAVGDFFASGYWTMSGEEQSAMPSFIDWLHSTPDGDLDTLDIDVKGELSCSGDECGGRRCPYYSRCFVYRARKAAAEAHLIVANHALVLTETCAGSGAILPPCSRIVFDEAHNLETIATDCLSREFSPVVLARLLGRLSRKARGRRARAGGVLAALEHQLQKGMFAGAPNLGEIKSLAAAVPGDTVRVNESAEALFAVLERLFAPKPDAECVRYRTENGQRRHALNRLFECYRACDWNEIALKSRQSAFENALAGLVNRLHSLKSALEESAPPGEFNFASDLALKLGLAADSLVAFANDAAFVIAGEKPTHAFWAERVTPEKRNAYLRLVAAPLSVAGELKSLVYNLKDSVILSSATLRVGSDFRYMASHLGCNLIPPGGAAQSGDESCAGSEMRFRALVAASPFNYLEQSLVLAVDFLSEPVGDGLRYAEELAPVLTDVCVRSRGRTLVLFTSYELMNDVAARVGESFAAAGLDLRVQGGAGGTSRQAMTAAMKRAKKPVVLFGAQSFWEGVDIAGDALSCVVIVRLPFAQMRDPIVEARSDSVTRRGGNAFRDYSLPEAVIKFRQGFGRLIRSRSDRGVVIVTDPRLVTKTYGVVFRRALPTSVHTITDAAELGSKVSEFLDSGGR